MTSRRAIVLFNLGAPDSLEAVRPFLFNLFNDKAIFRLPQPFRSWLAAFVAKRRAPTAIEIYRHLGGGSPLLPNTDAQATALHRALGGGGDIRVFIAMRYWHPFTTQTVAEVQAWGPDEIILLPLYPQYSTTTTASSLAAWHESARFLRLKTPTKAVCCYPTEPGFVSAVADLIGPALDQAKPFGSPRLLLSAHGLPEKVVKGGDPYQFQCEQTAAAIVARLEIPYLDWQVCYQSRVGPLKWIGPSTEEAIRQAAHDKRPVVVAPIAFVSEHSETLVEIEIEYRKLAADVGLPYFARVPTVGVASSFIAGLAGLVKRAASIPDSTGCVCISAAGGRICPPSCTSCPLI
ncbi:MAG: ferrochelatase [Rhodospirillales bacterium]|nr:ferrochelatase [Rhodospirillales bacterium]